MEAKHVNTDTESSIFRRRTIISTILLSLLIFIAGGAFLSYRIISLRKESTELLKAFSQLKINEFLQWKKERLSEAGFFANNDLIRNMLDEKPANSNAEYDLTELLRPFINSWRYENVFIFSDDGNQVFSYYVDSSFFSSDLKKRQLTAIKDSSTTADFYFYDSGNTVYFEIITPVSPPDGGPPGTILLRTDPDRFLYPLLRTWPTPSKSSEIILLRRDGDSIIYINPAGYENLIPAGHKINIEENKLAETAAVNGKYGLYDGSDYQGHKVLSYISSIPETGWFMIAKVDKQELFSATYSETALISLIIILLIVLTVLLFNLRYSFLERNMYKSLHEVEAKYLSVFENSLDAILLTSPDGKVLAANPAACELFGKTEREIISGGREGLVDVSDPRFKILIEERRKKGKAKGEIFMLKKDGTRFPVEISSAVYSDENSNKRTSMIIRDISKRKNDELALILSEEKFNKSFQNSPDAITLTKAADGTLIEVNKSFEKMSGFSREQVQGQSSVLMNLWADPEDRKLYVNALKEKGSIKDFETRFMTSSGEIRDFFVSGEIFILNREAHILGVLRDVTEQKKAAKEIIKLNERLNYLILAVKDLAAARDMMSIQNVIKQSSRRLVNSDGVTFVLREDGKCHYADEEAIEPLWKGQKFPMESCISGWAMLNMQSVAIEDIYADERIPVDEYRKTFVKSLLMVPMKIKTSIGAIGNYWAVSHIPSGMEIQLIESLADAAAIAIDNVRLYNELESMVAERTEQLLAVNRELEAFSFSVSHDLRAPLRGIDGFTKVLADEYGSRLDEEGRRLCSVIRENTVRMGKLIDDLLSFSRLGRRDLNKSAVDMEKMANSIYHEIAESKVRKGIEMRINPLPDAPADPNMIRQVWANLISNAVKFSSKVSSPVIEISSSETEQKYVYYVRDNGAGFDMRYKDKLFGVFQRLHSIKEFEGTGVGLALVQRIVHRHGGEVGAEGAPGKGATFWFSLPKV